MKTHFHAEIITLMFLCLTTTASTKIDAAPSEKELKPFVYEFYYKVKWGYFDEFLELYKKNHLPILRKQKERGEILEISGAFPINHADEEKRWDLRITITYRDVIAALEDPLNRPWVKELYPDQAKFKREEQRRFELLLEHMDVPVTLDDLSTW